MLFLFGLLVLPPLLIFGVYHLGLWFNVLGMARQPFWRRVALASAMGHLLLAAGLFLFMYLDYRASREIIPPDQSFETFLFSRSSFWRILLVLDVVPGVILAGLFGLLALLGWDFVPNLALLGAVVLSAGTLQWYWLGAALGAGFERLWSGLKTPDDDLPDWM